MDLAFNISNLTAPIIKGECILGNGNIDAFCVYDRICKDVNTHFTGWAIGLLVAFVLIDLGLPLLLPRIWHKIAPFLGSSKIGPVEAVAWLKDRLLLAFAAFVFYQLVF
jgi:hypothetical protein